MYNSFTISINELIKIVKSTALQGV